ncbi:hypothetical protein EHQ05_08760 [Leptospira yasudae]|uniref:hypothetical protein n=1 Tax=Leptospira yasudae TaxID=2202201 RepID=UPI001083A13E|nr:hypothetical protein [Leptospira yasudae]TGK27868.1 hypothetical protein EHQ05_08760 [Leptospira yasudae]TGM06993.1 hypothetical protein EHQ86_08815 [Leptospira yasudae]
MELIFEERVEQALRHLQSKDLKKTFVLLEKLRNSNFEQFKLEHRAKKIISSSENIFVVRINEKLRLLLRYGNDQSIILEDIVSHDILEKFFHRRRS